MEIRDKIKEYSKIKFEKAFNPPKRTECVFSLDKLDKIDSKYKLHPKTAGCNCCFCKKN